MHTIYLFAPLFHITEVCDHGCKKKKNNKNSIIKIVHAHFIKLSRQYNLKKKN